MSFEVNLSSSRWPVGRERATAVLHYNDHCEAVLGEPPITHMRRQLAGVQRIRPLARVLTLFVIAELTAAGRPLHWRDVDIAWRAHNAAVGRARWDDDQFWEYLAPALSVGVLTCTWDAAWAVSA